MKILILFIPAIFFLIAAQSQTVISVQHGSTTFLETRLDSAVAHAQNGDFIYLPGGVISGTANLIISKRLTIIGAGYHPDSSLATTPTKILGSLLFNPGAEGSLLTGVFCLGNIGIGTSAIIISRSNIEGILITERLVSGLLIEENIIRDRVYTQGTSGATLSHSVFRKNALYGNFQSFDGPITFLNNIFFNYIVYVTTSSFQNNIFTSASPLTFGGGSEFSNNLFVANSFSGADTSSNIFNAPIATIFQNYTNGAAWNKNQNFHLQLQSRGKGFGGDGKDVGIYGSSTPFKDGGIPFNPHFQSVVIPGSTSPSGNLNINITVKAQAN